MRTRLLAGRTFTGDDNLPGRNHVIIDEFLASKAFPKESAIGKRILVRVRKAEPEWLEVIGVVAHQRTSSLADAGREQVYFTDGLFGPGAVRSWALRTSNDVAGYGNEVRTAIKAVDPRLLVTQIEPADELVYRCASDHTVFAAANICLCCHCRRIGRRWSLWRVVNSSTATNV